MKSEVLEKKDYSLIGKDSIKAVQKGLAEANWYTPPIPREKMRELLERKNGPAIIDTTIWFSLMGISGYFIYALWGTWWVIMPILIYSVLYASSSDSRWHESSHGTAFKTDWMNNVLYEISSFMVFRQSTLWRWSHTRHHSDTIIVGRDPEIATPRPPDIPGIILNLFALKSAPAEIKKLLRHASGTIGPVEKQYLPESEYKKVIVTARWWFVIYGTVIALAIYFQSFLPLFYIGIPTLIGSYMIIVYGLTQHSGLQENVLDHRLNCRTIYMNRVHRFLYWNMNYHLEHHMFPLVPYHNLPKLHALIKDYCPTPYNGLISTWREIIPALKRQVKDPTYYVKRELPKNSETKVTTNANTFRAGKNDAVNGKVVVCSKDKLAKGDVIRFDCDGETYAIYQTENGKYYATDGVCTHGNTHLAEGLVIGSQIECPKHNGRFSMVDGSVKRAPVCKALKTYKVSVENDIIMFNLDSAGGEGLNEIEQDYDFKVISNKNVATFIKELVVEPVEEMAFKYQSGEYMQLAIPVHAISFEDFVIDEPYKNTWDKNSLFKLKSANLANTRRNYSMATNPATDKQLRFNVRIALPPLGKDCHAGLGSSYVYGLKPGDIVKISGPYGDFHLKETEKEMVYIGGGAGMAPLRSHIATLFETQKTKRKVSFWYGARSLQELFYHDYFSKIQYENENFRFEIALSESLPKDNWNSHTGFIHDVLFKEYLEDHPNPKSIEYYICGPPAMLNATREMLSKLGVTPDQIAFDDFS